MALLGTPIAIRLFSRHGYGQPIREEGPAEPRQQAGHADHGRPVIIIATVIGYFAGHIATGEPVTVSGVLVLFLMTGLGAVGFADDFIKITSSAAWACAAGPSWPARSSSGVVFAILALQFPDGYDLTPASSHLSFLPTSASRSARSPSFFVVG